MNRDSVDIGEQEEERSPAYLTIRWFLRHNREVVSPLQKAGLIESQRGRITIVNRRGLEATACECYTTLRQHGDYPWSDRVD
ncbi:hypothetical protein IFO70_24305 [Phormidium tenue FACHB-886]|nr:hypothetical protein [Phormidium tenue FACHB-886]